MNKEITIIGGGLTGLSLAIALRRNNIPVTLHEAGSYPKHRVCGEFISGISQQTLKTLGISDLLQDAKKHQSIGWYFGDESLREIHLPSPAYGISRFTLDDRLQHFAKKLGAKLHLDSRWGKNANKAGIIRATGRRPIKGDWIGLKVHIRNLSIRADLEMYSGPIGYLGITPVENNWFNVCGLFRVDKKINAKKEALLTAYLRKNGNHQLAHRLDFAKWREGSFSAVAGFGLGFQKTPEGALTLGDSHSIIPPFTGNGMSMALQSAETALPHLIAYAQGNTHWEKACKEISAKLKRKFSKRMRAASIVHPMLFQRPICTLIRRAPVAPFISLIR